MLPPRLDELLALWTNMPPEPQQIERRGLIRREHPDENPDNGLGRVELAAFSQVRRAARARRLVTN